MNIIFFGSAQNSADLLTVLDRDPRFKILAVVTQPDRPVGRNKILTPTPVAQYAQKNNIITLKPLRHPQKKHLIKNANKLYKQILSILFKDSEKKSLDLILSYEFGQLIPSSILKLARFGGLNIHFSLLPAYRGAAPIPWQIANGETETGISVVKMSDKFDKGRIIYQEKHPIKPNDTTQTLHKRLSKRVLKIMPAILADYTSGNLPTPPNFPALPDSYYPRLTRQHGYIPWNDFLQAISVSKQREKLACEIERKIRAFSPWPGVWTKTPTGKRLKILSAKLKNNRLLPLKVQVEGKNPTRWHSLATSLSCNPPRVTLHFQYSSA